MGNNGKPSSFADSEKGGIARTVSTYFSHFKKGLVKEKSGGLKPMHVNYNYQYRGKWQETNSSAQAIYRISGYDWMKKTLNMLNT